MSSHGEHQIPSPVPSRVQGQAPNNKQISIDEIEAPRAQRGASRKGNFFYIVPLDPAYKAGLAGHLPVKSQTKTPETNPRIPPLLRDCVEIGKSAEHFEKRNRQACEKALGRYL